MTLGGVTWDIEITLTNRDSMGYRMLFGREAMKKNIVINPSEQFLLGDLSHDDIKKKYVKIDKARSGLKIGILASNPSLYSNDRLMIAGEERGHDMIF